MEIGIVYFNNKKLLLSRFGLKSQALAQALVSASQCDLV
jgi:hypothetical protein